MSDYHEPTDELSAYDRDLHRALTSLKEEIEAVDWYHQRVVLATDPALKKVLEHNRDEEIEHATMTLEWLRRHMPAWNEQLSTYLFTDAEITEIEDVKELEEAKGKNGLDGGRHRAEPTAAGLGLGGLRREGEDR